jgi:hypothetical protein
MFIQGGSSSSRRYENGVLSLGEHWSTPGNIQAEGAERTLQNWESTRRGQYF